MMNKLFETILIIFLFHGTIESMEWIKVVPSRFLFLTVRIMWLMKKKKIRRGPKLDLYVDN